MGTWGAGNLENDYALDLVSERSSELTANIWKGLNSKTSTEADEFEYIELFVNIDTIVALNTAGLFSGWKMPLPTELDAVVKTWLDDWSTYFEGMGSSEEFKAERRAVIEKTFASFREILVIHEERR